MENHPQIVIPFEEIPEPKWRIGARVILNGPDRMKGLSGTVGEVKWKNIGDAAKAHWCWRLWITLDKPYFAGTSGTLLHVRRGENEVTKEISLCP